MSRQGGLRIERMCQLAQVSRAGFYRSLQEAQPVEEAMRVRTEFRRLRWRIDAGTAIDGSRRSCAGGVCW